MRNKVTVEHIVADFRCYEAAHYGDIGENNPGRGSIQLAGDLSFRNRGRHVEFSRSIQLRLRRSHRGITVIGTEVFRFSLYTVETGPEC